MLKQLNIQNIALIENLELELGKGLQILSGETGAGKSIIIDSLNFVLGERADKTLIRYGTNFAIVEAVFEDYQNDAINTYLQEFGIDSEEFLIIKRKMTLEGKNECRINGKLCNLSLLKKLTELLVDIHGQHEHQSLLKVSNHINLLDSIGEDKIAKAKNQVKINYKKYTSLKKEHSKYGNMSERERKMDILKFQIDEIENSEIKDGEEQELLDKRKRIRNMEKILNALNISKNTLDGYDGNSVALNIKYTIASLSSISNFDENIAKLEERLESCKLEIEDIADSISNLFSELDFDSKSAEDIENRLDIVRNMQRKYGGNFESMSEFYNNAKNEYEMLENAGNRILQIENEMQKVSEILIKDAKLLSVLRMDIARQFEKSIISELNDLKMSGSTFKVEIISNLDLETINENGADSVEFLISPNKGEPLKPLAKIISGGEMSRFMLALKNIVADIDEIGTMVFDEIDTGISGNVSAVVSEKMCNISRNRQVIAVTHMPSLAAMADNHYLISKHTRENKTLTQVDLLKDDINEVARLIGGSDYSIHAIPHAKEMKSWAEKYKENKKEVYEKQNFD